MNLILFLILAAIVIYLFAVYYPWEGISTRELPWPQKTRARIPRSTRTAEQPQKPLTRGAINLKNLHVGDVVSYLNRDFLVVELRDVQENEWLWRDYILEDGEDIYQLSVGEDGEEAFLLEPTLELSLPSPPPNALRYNRYIYQMTSSGQARVTNTRESFRYYTYEGPPGHVIVVEDWGGQYDVYIGESIYSSDLQLLPGSPENLG